MKAFLALLRIDLKLALRNRLVLFFNYFFPLVFFFMFGQMYGAKEGGAIALQVVAMVTAIGILGNGLFGAGMRAVQEREENILRRYKVTPITPVPLLAASMATGLIIFVPALVLILLLANRLYGMPIPGNLLSLFLFVGIGTAAFRAIGLIVAAVVNSSQESQILIQPIYLGMLLLSGVTIPLTVFPKWLQIVAQFIPASYLISGIGGILQRGESILQNLPALFALIGAAFVGLFISTKLFRWEKDEKLQASAKLWVLVVLLPFFLLGAWQAWSQHDIAKARILARQLSRGRSYLIENARIFVGNGQAIESGAVLVRAGKIAAVYDGSFPDAKTLRAESIDAAGKTVLPGLIDMHVHLGSPGGSYDDWTKFNPTLSAEHELEAYLYCGITAVRSAGDMVDEMLKLRAPFASGEKLGAELFLCGPLFTVEGGHGTEYAKNLPQIARAGFDAQFVRTPKTQEEARREVDALAAKGVDAIKGVLEAGLPVRPFIRMKLDLLRAVVDEGHAKHLPVSIHTGDSRDATDAVALGADSIEHGSYRDAMPDAVFDEMKRKGIAFDPTLSVVEGYRNFAEGNLEALKRSLVQQVTPRELIVGTEHAAADKKANALREEIGRCPMSLDIGVGNLIKAWHAGVMLVTGSDAGNPLVLHGPTVQREIELWVAGGMPPAVALQAATGNAAKLLHASDRIGTIEKGKEASLLIVDGNPLQDVRVLSSISTVFFKGERVRRPDLFKQK